MSCARPATRCDGLSQPSQLGTYSEGVQSITVHPGPESYHAPDRATIHMSDGVVDSITDEHGQTLSSYELEPLLITGLSEDANRTKRRLLTYDEIPPNLVHAVLAIEDRQVLRAQRRRLLSHDQLGHGTTSSAIATSRRRIHADHAAGQASVPARHGHHQVQDHARSVISIHLEHRFTKKQIFEMYANEINLGQRGSFSIDGFGEASQAYFGKDVRQLDLAECAMLAGIIQSPSYFNPFRHPERAIERRNLVLDSMVETGAITKEQAERAKAEPLHLAPASVDASEAPYFVDLVHDQLIAEARRPRFQSRRIAHLHVARSRICSALATAAVDSTAFTMWTRWLTRCTRRHKKLGKPYTYPQVALIALESAHGPGAGAGGRPRATATSQVNHAVAHRPNGIDLQAICLRGGVSNRH